MSLNPQPSIPQLYFSFLRLGVTAFGGPSMVAYIRKLAVTQRHWIEAETFNDGVALCQMLPGATAMQTAAYVGLKTRGAIGASACFIGFGFPAFLFMMALAAVYTKTHNLPIVISVFNGLQTIIVAIIANATLSFGKTAIKNRFHFVIAGFAALLFGLNVNPIFVILLTALGGLALIKPKYPNQFQADTALQKPSTLKPLLLILSGAAAGFLFLFIFQRNLFELAVLFLRIDLFAFGGGFASVPLMFHEIVEVHSWLDSPTFMNGIVLGQVTPGPIVITATFIGYLLYGPFGGLIATISIFLPSFAMVIGVSPYFDQLRASPYFNRIINGVLCSFVGLLFTVTIRFAWNIHWDLAHLLLGSAALIALLLKVDILWVVLAGALISVAIFI